MDGGDYGTAMPWTAPERLEWYLTSILRKNLSELFDQNTIVYILSQFLKF